MTESKIIYIQPNLLDYKNVISQIELLGDKEYLEMEERNE